MEVSIYTGVSYIRMWNPVPIDCICQGQPPIRASVVISGRKFVDKKNHGKARTNRRISFTPRAYEKVIALL